MARLFVLAGAVVSLAFLSGCSDYAGDFAYVPHPALVEVAPVAPDRTPPVSTFASVIGVRRADSGQDIPESVQVRIRLENNGPHSVFFDPQSLELTTGDLRGFAPPKVRPLQSVTLAPAETAIFDVFFPFPQGSSYDNTDMRSLQLRWRVQIDSGVVGQAVSFRRIYPYRYYAYPDPYWGYPSFYGGVVIVGHRR